jgi:hypothetical protein
MPIDTIFKTLTAVIVIRTVLEKPLSARHSLLIALFFLLYLSGAWLLARS